MGKIFDYDNVFFRGMGKLVDVFFASVLWVIFSLPLITIGASTQALYYTVHKQIKGGRGYVWQEFFASFRDHLKDNILLSLLFEVLLLVLSYERVLLHTMMDNGGDDILTVMYFLVIFFQLLLVTWAIYTFCYRARFEMDRKNSLKNGLLLMLGYLPKSLLILLSFVAVGVLVYIMPVLICFLPVLLFLFYDFLLEKVFRAIMNPEDLEKEEEFEMERKRDNVE